MKKTYAHTKKMAPPENWQSLDKHLQNVARMSSGFADSFGASQWGRLVGLVHDVGKARPAFQKKLLDNLSKHEDHKGVGARLFYGSSGSSVLLTK